MPDTDLKYGQNASEFSEETYHTLFNLFGQGFCICELLVDAHNVPLDYRFLEVNVLFEEHTGLRNAAGRTALQLVPNLEYHWIELYGKVALTGESLRFEQESVVMGRWFDVYAFRFGPVERRQFCIVFNDISQRKKAEERSKTLQMLTSFLSKSVTWQEVVDIIIQKVMKAVEADSGTIIILSENSLSLDVVESFGYSQQSIKKWQNFQLNDPTGLTALAVRENRQLWISSVEERLQILPVESDLLEESHIAWTIIPFNINGNFMGAITLGFDGSKQFDVSEQTFITTLSEYCAQALHRARLTEQIGQLAVAQERKRIAHDLHDAVKQNLFVSSLIAESLPAMFDKSPEKAKQLIGDLVNLNRAALAELHSLLLEMRPEAIVTSPFMSLVRNLCNGLNGRKSIKINIKHEGPEELFLPADTHITLYRLVQESLNNVYKHSNATELSIDCVYTGHLFRVVVRDNGQGFDVQHTTKGFGMHTMRERAQSIGASFNIKSSPNEGTEITVEWQAEEVSQE